MVDLEKIKSISKDDYSIGLEFGHYVPLKELIDKYNLKEGIEIGCAYGNLAKYLLENSTLNHLYSVDPFASYTQMPCLQTQEDYDLLYEYTNEKLKSIESKTGFELCRDTSQDAFKIFSLKKDIDFVFLDGNHTYEDVSWEIEHYSKIIQSGGILSGHDITVFEGVDKAVYEYAEKSGKELHTLKGNIWYFEM